MKRSILAGSANTVAERTGYLAGPIIAFTSFLFLLNMASASSFLPSFTRRDTWKSVYFDFSFNPNATALGTINSTFINTIPGLPTGPVGKQRLNLQVESEPFMVDDFEVDKCI